MKMTQKDLDKIYKMLAMDGGKDNGLPTWHYWNGEWFRTKPKKKRKKK